MTHGQQPLLERAGDGERRGAPVPRPEAAGATPPPGADGRWRRHRRWLYGLAVVALLGQMAVAMVTAAVRQTPTIDEPVYVATAVVQTQQHSLRYNPEHPPLGKLLIAAGTVFA
ncbi:phospholipid carrier-dependent glycosyltransferase, partial [Streptomyces sp. NPDC048845]